MRVAIIQPSYIPWLGYLYLVNNVDLFIYFDVVQYDKGGWRNRNRVMCYNEVKWLTLSINKKALPECLSKRYLNKVELLDNQQFLLHNHILKNYYPLPSQKALIEELYPSSLNNILLCDAVIAHNNILFQHLGIDTKIIRSSDLSYGHKYGEEYRNANLINILKLVGATEYISGFSAKSYINLQLFADFDIRVTWNPFPRNDQYSLSSLHYFLLEGRQRVLGYIN